MLVKLQSDSFNKVKKKKKKEEKKGILSIGNASSSLGGGWVITQHHFQVLMYSNELQFLNLGTHFCLIFKGFRTEILRNLCALEMISYGKNFNKTFPSGAPYISELITTVNMTSSLTRIVISKPILRSFLWSNFWQVLTVKTCYFLNKNLSFHQFCGHPCDHILIMSVGDDDRQFNKDLYLK